MFLGSSWKKGRPYQQLWSIIVVDKYLRIIVISVGVGLVLLDSGRKSIVVVWVIS